ncbi:MAG: homocysteine S-methyltransferase family protein [Lachnospiraceae bacterium]
MKHYYFDGAMGTILQKNGLAAGELPELWNITKPELIVDVHQQYLQAGANLIVTNTFGANALKISHTEYSVSQVITAAVNNAKKAIVLSGKEAYIALDLGPTGKLMKPYGDLAFDEAYNLYKEMILAGTKAGAHFVLLETMSDLYEAKAGVLAAKENSALPVVVTMVFDEDGKLLTGANIETAVATLEGLGVDAIGFNCGLGPVQMQKLLPRLVSCCSKPIIVNPNAGLPVYENGETIFKVGPDEFAQAMTSIVHGGATIIGGCCGTTPDHIKAMIDVCDTIDRSHITEKQQTVVTSSCFAVTIDQTPVIIGERINPTGKKKLKEALKAHDMDYIYREGLTQAECGAHILDVNVGLPEIDEVALLTEAVLGLQAITTLPLQLDTSDITAMEQAMRLYNGKPMINSVNGKQEIMEQIFPLVKKYGGVVVGLTLDETGIPETAAGRLEIARRIIDTAADYGISKKDIVIDPLAMTISTGQQNAQVALDCLHTLRYELGVHTVLGVSNISFGLPKREIITSTFYALAMEQGLSAGIINPSSAAMMNTYYSYCALKGYDQSCVTYIEQMAAMPDMPTTTATAVSTHSTATQSVTTLHQAVIKGLKDMADALTREALATMEPLEIIDTILIPALDEVGQGFEKNTIFLPQLLMSADAAKAAFDVLKEQMSKSNVQQESKGTVLIATVKGDIHEIGKNIVKVLLENYSFEVIDLGSDVSPEEILSVAKEQKIRLVGLSALMTTTVVYMMETIELLHQEYPECKIMVGGAVLTPEYAKQIHADHYSRDAMGSVRYANELFSK